MKGLRWLLWNVLVRVCDRIGAPITAAIWTLPEPVAARIGTGCSLLHPQRLIAFEVPDEWWDRAGWAKPDAEAVGSVEVTA